MKVFLHKLLDDSKVDDAMVEKWSTYYREDVVYAVKTKLEARAKINQLNDDILERWYWTAARHVKGMNAITDKVKEVPKSLAMIDLPDHKDLNLSRLEHVKLHMSKAEALARNFFAVLFKEMDTDKDGKITFDEFVAFRTNNSKVDAKKKEQLRQEFDLIDTKDEKTGERDGVLKFEEIINFSVANTKFNLGQNMSV